MADSKPSKRFYLHPDGLDPDSTPKSYPSIPWGRYKGVPLDEVPNSYLEWALSEADMVRNNPNLYESIKTRLMLEPFVPDDDGRRR